MKTFTQKNLCGDFDKNRIEVSCVLGLTVKLCKDTTLLIEARWTKSDLNCEAARELL
jgi:hypothetical protein